MRKRKKYYVVWKGRQTGVFERWDDCKKSVYNFKQSQYKSFISQGEAELAFERYYKDYKGKDTTNYLNLSLEKTLNSADKKIYGLPIKEAIAVDAACSGHPGKMEYRGVLVANGKELFKGGPFEKGTSCIGEFLAIVHAIAYQKKNHLKPMPIYSDSEGGLKWVAMKKCRTKSNIKENDEKLYKVVKRAVIFLENNTVTVPLLKWHTYVWGEIPADFGRKK